MSNLTKKALEASLKNQLLHKPLTKIRVTDIANDCGINRMTFYYHFKDIYDLVEWAIIEDSRVILEDKKTYATWEEGYLRIFEAVYDNREFIKNVYYCVSREQVEKYLYPMTYHLLMDVIKEKSHGLSVREEDQVFIAEFYKYGFVGLVLDWVKKGMKEDPKVIVKRLSILIQGDIEKALHVFKQKK